MHQLDSMRIYTYIQRYTHTHTHTTCKERSLHQNFFLSKSPLLWLSASSWGVRKTNGLVTPHPRIPPKAFSSSSSSSSSPLFALFLDRSNLLYIYISIYSLYFLYPSHLLLLLLLHFYFVFSFLFERH